jgi:hypothetical protein
MRGFFLVGVGTCTYKSARLSCFIRKLPGTDVGHVDAPEKRCCYDQKMEAKQKPMKRRKYSCEDLICTMQNKPNGHPFMGNILSASNHSIAQTLNKSVDYTLKNMKFIATHLRRSIAGLDKHFQ